MNNNPPRVRDTSASAVIWPRTLHRSQEFEVLLDGWTDFASRSIQVHIGLTSAPSYLNFRPLSAELDASGNGRVPVPQGFDVEGLWGAHVDHVSCDDQSVIPANNPAALVNWDNGEPSDMDVQLVHQELWAQNKLLHDSPVGDPSNPSNQLHFSAVLLAGVLTTQHVIYPGLITIPLSERPVDREHVELLNGFLLSLHLPVLVDEDKWADSKASRYPMTAVLIPQIWAPDFDEAHRIARELIERLQLVLAVNRLANADPVAVVIAQRQPDDSSKSRIYPYETRYEGNLLGGDLAGESPDILVGDFERLKDDSLVSLCAGLFSEAIAERNEDFKFFKYWSVLETLSERLGDEGPVALLTGSDWPEKVRPMDPGPRVYSMLAKILTDSSISEDALPGPATDLYELVQVFKARRNATAHYGGFAPANAAQQARGWFPYASKSLGSEAEWIESLRWISLASLRFALEAGPQQSDAY